MPSDFVLCTTIETNHWINSVMNRSLHPVLRAEAMKKISKKVETYVTVEPIMRFNLVMLVGLIRACNPVQVNIGADSGRNGLDEPTWDEVQLLIDELKCFTTVVEKKNLKRLKGKNDGKD